MDELYSLLPGKAEFDESKFFLGPLCRHGHAWKSSEFSLRYRHGSHPCLECDKQRRPKNFQSKRQARIELAAAQKRQGIDLSNGFYLGGICEHGHQWNGSNLSLRYVSCGSCAECKKSWNQVTNRRDYARDLRSDPERWAAELERRKQYNRQVRASNIRKGLTSTGKPVKSPAMQQAKLRDKESSRLLQTLRSFKPFPSVAQLVYQEQKRYWEENPNSYREFCRQRARDRAKWRHMTDLEYRLYHRQKSKRRKAIIKHIIGNQLTGKQVRQRFAQFDHRCAYCGAIGEDLHIEHVVPISKGGPHALGNIIPACRACNFSKRDHDAEEWYRAQDFYSELRWRKICRVLGWHKSAVGQLALL